MVFLNTCLKQDTSGPSKSSSKILEKEVGLSSDGIIRRRQAISRHPVIVRITSGVWDVLIHCCHAQQISKCFMNNNEGQPLAKRDKDTPAQRKLQKQSDSRQLLLATLAMWFQSPQPALRGRWSCLPVFCSSQRKFLPSLFTNQYFTQAHDGLIAILTSKWL